MERLCLGKKVPSPPRWLSNGAGAGKPDSCLLGAYTFSTRMNLADHFPGQTMDKHHPSPTKSSTVRTAPITPQDKHCTNSTHHSPKMSTWRTAQIIPQDKHWTDDTNLTLPRMRTGQMAPITPQDAHWKKLLPEEHKYH